MSLIRTVKHAPTRGKDVAVYVARLGAGDRTKPVEQTLTIGASPVAKGATTVPLTAPVQGTINAGQYLLFVDANDREYLALVTTTVKNTDANNDELTVRSLNEAIPAGSTAEFPVYVYDRTDSSTTRSNNLSEVNTYNTGDNRDGVITGGSADISLPGLYYHYNAGAQTLSLAAKDGAEVWISKELAPPNDRFTKGLITEGAAVVTSRNNPSPGDGFVALDFEVAWVGAVDDVDPVPVA